VELPLPLCGSMQVWAKKIFLIATFFVSQISKKSAFKLLVTQFGLTPRACVERKSSQTTPPLLYLYAPLHDY
jgi:hypothetical protein